MSPPEARRIALRTMPPLADDTFLTGQNAAFIAETPVDEPGDEMRNVTALRALSAS